MALYDSENKVAVLAHIDAMTDTDSLSRLFNLISKENTVAHLFGGNYSSQDRCMDIIEVLERNNIKIVNSDIARDSFGSASLAIDSRTGVIYAPVKHTQLNKTSDLDIRLQIAELQIAELQFGTSPLKSPLKQCYNGLQVTASLQPTPTVVPKKLALEKESKVDNTLPLTLGFLSVKKKAEKRQEPALQTYCGFKPGFLLK